MTEQPRSASKEALELVSRLRALKHEPGTAHTYWHELNLLDAGRAIDALIAQRVSAETERCAKIAGAERPAPAAVGDYTERARKLLRKLHCWQRIYRDARPLNVPDVGQIAAALAAVASERDAAPSSSVADYTERAREIISEWTNRDFESWVDTELAELRELIAAALSAVASERDAAAIRAFGQRMWSDTEEVAYQAGVNDTRARLQEPDVREAVVAAIADVNNEYGLADDMGDVALTKIAEMLK